MQGIPYEVVSVLHMKDELCLCPSASDIWFLRYEEQRKANAATEDRIRGLEKEVANLRG